MRFFSRYIWRFSLDKKEIYLTFDDGPTPEITEFVLDELKKYNAKATFFCIGKNIEKHPEIGLRILKDKHSLGNHTKNHFNGWKTSNIKYLENIIACEELILKIFEKFNNSNTKGAENVKLNLFRPPYGKLKKRQAKEILKKGYKIIMWDVLSADFDTTISNERCLLNVLNHTNNGSIIVFHDSAKAAKKVKFVLPKILEEFSKQGFVFKAI